MTEHASLPPPRPVAIAAATLGFTAYFVSLHVLVVSEIAPVATCALIVGPWIGALVVAIRASRAAPSRRCLPALLAAAVAVPGALAWCYGDRLAGRVDAVLLIENLAFLIALCGLFASSLFVGREALITRLARIARNGRLPQQAVQYTRRVTIAWAVFFATMALLSVVLYVTQSRTAWSTFVNLLIWPSMAALFAIEYAIRVRVLPDIAHVPMMSGIQAFRQRDAAATTTEGAG